VPDASPPPPNDNGLDDASRIGHAATLRRLEKSAGTLAAAAITRMDQSLPWYRAMPPENRSWIGLVAQAGIAAFTEWFRHPEAPQAISTDVFGTAPRELTRAITLRQTVEMVRTTIEVVEEAIEDVAAPGDEALLREALLVYAREIAFATAQVYAQAAEARGAWDARLESLVVNAVLSGEADEGVLSRAAALGWSAPDQVLVVLGTAPDGDSELTVDAIRRAARHARLQVLTGVLGDRLVVIAGGGADPLRTAKALIGPFARGPVVVGPVVPDLLSATRSAQAAAAGLRACAAWPDAPRPVLADDLLPERAIAGDAGAREQLVEEIYRPLEEAGSALLETLSVYLEQASSLEGAARMLFVHPNTVRYRLRRVTDVTGWSPSDVRSAFTLRTALILGRLADAEPPH
jgi:DNA-binding PucR family transcriptional regulator